MAWLVQNVIQTGVEKLPFKKTDAFYQGFVVVVVVLVDTSTYTNTEMINLLNIKEDGTWNMLFSSVHVDCYCLFCQFVKMLWCLNATPEHAEQYQ